MSWDDVVVEMRRLRANGPVNPVFLFTYGSDGYQQWNKKIFEVYAELFQPAGVTIGSVSPRASRRLDRFERPEDLIPDPARRRTATVVVPGAKEPAAAAQVVLLPTADPLPVALKGTRLRDPYDEYWVETDENGQFAVHPEEDKYDVAILHPSGFAFFRGPLRDAEVYRLQPWATVIFTSTGEAFNQSANIRVRPKGASDESPGLNIYEIKTMGKPIAVKVPPGSITVSRSLEVFEGTSIGAPVEQFVLEPGANRKLTVPAATLEDRAEAELQFFELNNRN